MFQLAVMLTFDSSATDQCLADIMTAYRDLGRMVRELHSCMLLQSIGCMPSDTVAKERFARILAKQQDTDPAEVERARDILTLAALERGKTQRFEGPHA